MLSRLSTTCHSRHALRNLQATHVYGVRYNSAAASSSSTSNPNQGILDMLKTCHEEALEAADVDKTHNHTFRARSFQRAISAIQRLRTPITSVDEAKKLEGVGAGIADRIARYLHGDEEMLDKAAEMAPDPDFDPSTAKISSKYTTKTKRPPKEPSPPKKIGRPRKYVDPLLEPTEPRPRGRPRKIVPGSDSETLRPLVIDPSIASLNIPPTDPAEKKRWTRQRRVIIEALQEISGIGRTKATELLTAGCRSPAALKTSTFFRMLTPAQRLGVVFHEQIEKPVKRAEAEAVAEFIRDHIPEGFEVHLVGSYRRDKPTSSDVDIILLHPQYELPRLHEDSGEDASDAPESALRNGELPAKSEIQSELEGAQLQSNGLQTDKDMDVDEELDAEVAASTTMAPTPGRRPLPFKDALYSTREDLASAMLTSRVVRPLQAAGLLAATRITGIRKWQGVARVPVRRRNTSGTLEVVGETGVLGAAVEQGRAKWMKLRQKQSEDEWGLEDLAEEAGHRMVRLDLNMVPWSSRATAFLALTGDTDFNIFLRARARRMGLVLNEYGLWKWEPSLSKSSGDVDAPQEPSAPPVLFPEHKERIKVKTGRPSKAGEGAEGDHTPGLGEGVEGGKWEKIETPTEQDVMSELGLGWVEPARRNYGLLAYKKK